jgi:3-phenylpropionate/cinnamic acid dioxygenase small subunit
LRNHSSKEFTVDSHYKIQRVIALYGQLLDDLRLAEWGELFTDDAVWSLPGVSFRGRAEIVRGVGAMEPKERRRVKHLAFTPIIDFEGDDRACAWTDLLVLTKSDEGVWSIASTGRYYDTFERSGGHWRFKSRVCDVEWPGAELDPAALRRPPSF